MLTKIQRLKWPIYVIKPHRAIYVENNIMYIETDFNTFIIDNKNLDGDTLGKRRLRIPEDKNIYKLTKILYTLSDLIKKGSGTYIDSSGYLFKYTKRTNHKLLYKKVKRVKVVDNILLCYCVGIHRPIEVPYIPRVMPKYLGLVLFKEDYLLYELSSTRKKDTWRAI